MSAAVAQIVYLNGPRQLEIREVGLSAAGAGELLCETIVTAISPGTELAAYTGLPPLRPGTGYPRLQGYCNVARVVGIGPGVVDFALGDRVLSFTSHRDRFVLAATEVLFTLPSDANADHIVTSYLFHLGYNAVLRSDMRPGSRVLVIGLGALGLTSVAMATAAGAEVHTLSNHAAPRKIAGDFGATTSFSRQEIVQQDAGIYDVIITTTNGWADWDIALRAASQRAVIAVLGFPGRGEPAPATNPLDSQYFYVKQLHIEAVGLSPEAPDTRGFLRFNERANLRYIADRILRRQLDPTPLVSGAFPGHQIEDAYCSLLDRAENPITFLLRWNHD